MRTRASNQSDEPQSRTGQSTFLTFPPPARFQLGRTRFNKRSGSSHDGEEIPQARACRKLGPEQVRHALDAATPNHDRIEELVGRLGRRALSERECGDCDGESAEQHVCLRVSAGAERSKAIVVGRKLSKRVRPRNKSKQDATRAGRAAQKSPSRLSIT